ncbi:MAG: GyrI-like domain-containing protein [Anaerolineae bacterium]
MQKIDLKKEWKHLYAPSAREVEVVDVPPLLFAMIDGRMQPGETPGTSQTFQEAVSALYGISYTLKFLSKKRKDNPMDYPVMPLEGLWWSASGEFDFNRPEDWQWTLMIMQPEHITAEMFQEALESLKKKRDSPALSRLRLERFHEGLCIQIMHVGPYATEAATIEKMKAFAQEHGYRYRGKHHEIYLGDPRRASPEKLRTILRQPVAKD